MSGIAGIIRFDGAPVEPTQISKITSAMAYRGPDGIHHWISGCVALGHCMLRTTPESLEEIQPFTDEQNGFAMVMDGRLDDRDVLAQELRTRGIALKGPTDAELVLRAYELWGEDCPSHLLGDFAFAIWDARRQRLFCARDHFGLRPFHYFCGEKFLAFASDEEAFFKLSGVPREPNEDRIAYVLYGFQFYEPDDSWLKEIVKLPPAKTLTVSCTGQKVVRTYWQLEPQEESRFASDLECEEAFRSVFSEAVRRRLRHLGNPAVMLSGGIDSASIAGATRHLLRQTPHMALHTFSVVADEASACTETRNIRAVIDGCRSCDHLIGVPSLAGPITADDLKTAFWDNAHPVANSILLPAMMCLAASRSGSQVMLDGMEGDLTTFTPRRYTSRLLRSGAWRDFLAECRQSSLNNTFLRGSSPMTTMLRSTWDVFMPGSLKRLKRAIGRRGESEFGSSLINRDFARDIRLAERLRDSEKRFRGDDLLSDQQQHIAAMLPANIPRGSEGYDRVASRYGIERRGPWSDKSLVEFYLRLPLRYKVRAGWTKYLVRKATAPWLHESVRWHSGKDHLGGKLCALLLKHSCREIVDGTADEALSRYVDTERLAVVVEKYKLDQENADAYAICNVATLAYWLGRVKKAQCVA